MDPKIAKLDPKLQEAYERVMGTQVPDTQDAAAPQPPASSEEAPPPPANPDLTPPPPEETSPAPPPGTGIETAPPQTLDVPPPPPVSSSDPSTVDLRSSAEATTLTSPPKVFQSFSADSPSSAAAHKNKARLSPGVLVIAAVIFFIIYALLWIKIFNIGLF